LDKSSRHVEEDLTRLIERLQAGHM